MLLRLGHRLLQLLLRVTLEAEGIAIIGIEGIDQLLVVPILASPGETRPHIHTHHPKANTSGQHS